jgi:hypothetical protein
MRMFYVYADGRLRGSYSESDLFINWQGGFVRRGLYGEILVRLHQTYSVDPYAVILLTFALLWLLFGYLYIYLVFDLSTSLLLRFALIFSPYILFFPVYDMNHFISKYLFVQFLLLIHALAVVRLRANKISINTYERFLYFFVCPSLIVVTLIAELQFLFILFHILLVAAALGFSNDAQERLSLKKSDIGVLWTTYRKPLSFALFSSAIPFILSIFVQGNEKQVEMASLAIRGWTGPWMSSMDEGAAAMILNSISSPDGRFQFTWNSYGLSTPRNSHFLTYALMFLLGPVALYLLVCMVRHVRPSLLIVLASVPAMSLFLLGVDWGRWVSLIATAWVAVAFVTPSRVELKVGGYKASHSLRFRLLLAVVLVSNLFLRVPVWGQNEGIANYWLNRYYSPAEVAQVFQELKTITLRN